NARLDAGLLIRTDDVIVRPQRFFLPKTGIKIEDDLCLVGELRIARKDPILIAPRFQVRLMQHAPDRAAADRFTQSGNRALRQIGQRLTAQRPFRFKNDLTSKRLHGGLIHRGKNRACARALVYLPKRSRPTPSVAASVGPRRPAYQWRQLPLRATSPGIGAANKRCSLPQLKTDGSLSPQGLRLGQE